jgi:hypothetical protein
MPSVSKWLKERGVRTKAQQGLEKSIKSLITMATQLNVPPSGPSGSPTYPVVPGSGYLSGTSGPEIPTFLSSYTERPTERQQKDSEAEARQARESIFVPTQVAEDTAVEPQTRASALAQIEVFFDMETRLYTPTALAGHEYRLGEDDVLNWYLWRVTPEAIPTDVSARRKSSSDSHSLVVDFCHSERSLDGATLSLSIV